MIDSLFIFIVAMFLVTKGATMATRHATFLAEELKLSRYVVGFIVVAVISILPETFIAINSAIEGVSSFGLGTLLGSNVADMTLVFAIIILYAKRDLKVEGKILKNHIVYPFILILPLLLGLNGHFSRTEGLVLMLSGGIFYYTALRNGFKGEIKNITNTKKIKNLLFLLFGMSILIVGSHFVVISATSLANFIGVNPILVGMLVVGLGTTIPELFFSLRSVKNKDDSLAVGDILGTVLADATIVVGILALINPFYFSVKLIYITGVFMVIASFLLFHFMDTGRTLNKKEAIFLFIFWVVFVLVEFLINK